MNGQPQTMNGGANHFDLTLTLAFLPIVAQVGGLDIGISCCPGVCRAEPEACCSQDI